MPEHVILEHVYQAGSQYHWENIEELEKNNIFTKRVYPSENEMEIIAARNRGVEAQIRLLANTHCSKSNLKKNKSSVFNIIRTALCR